MIHPLPLPSLAVPSSCTSVPSASFIIPFPSTSYPSSHRPSTSSIHPSCTLPIRSSPPHAPAILSQMPSFAVPSSCASVPSASCDLPFPPVLQMLAGVQYYRARGTLYFRLCLKGAHGGPGEFCSKCQQAYNNMKHAVPYHSAYIE